MKSKNKLVIFLAVYFFALPVFADAKSLYVNQAAGNDSVSYASNDPAHPWRTLGRALWGNPTKTSPVSGEAAQAGDTVIVSPGTYSYAGSGVRYEPAFNPVNSGTPGNPIVIRADGTVRLTLSSGTGPVFGANNKNYITWDGFSADESDHAVYGGEPTLGAAWGSSNIIFQNLIFLGQHLQEDDRNHSAIRFEGSRNCHVHNSTFSGFSGAGENHADIYLYSSDDILVEHNNHYDGNGACFVKGSGNDRFVFRYNLIYNMAGPAIRLGPSSAYGRVYQNIIHDSLIGLRNDSWLGELGRDNIYANNTIVSIGLLGMQQHGNDYPSFFYNNIIVDIRGTNNLGGAAGSWAGNSPGTNVFEHNLYSGLLSQDQFWYSQGEPDRYGFSYWQGTWGKDTASPAGRIADPLFVNKAGRNFHLQAGSPARTLGMDILDLDRDGSTTDIIPAGAYITGNEIIGIIEEEADITPPSEPNNLSVI